MKIITDCPFCKKDFMYDPNHDYHLIRSLVSESEGDLTETIAAICQDCDEIEGVADYIKEKAEYKGWENAQYLSQEKFGVVRTQLAMDYFTKKNL